MRYSGKVSGESLKVTCVVLPWVIIVARMWTSQLLHVLVWFGLLLFFCVFALFCFVFKGQGEREMFAWKIMTGNSGITSYAAVLEGKRYTYKRRQLLGCSYSLTHTQRSSCSLTKNIFHISRYLKFTPYSNKENFQ